MMIYEVNLWVDQEIFPEFTDWLNSHIQEILTLPGFTGARLYRLSDEVESAFCVHYELENEAALSSYLENHAERFRQEGLTRFQGRFRATRRVLKTERLFSALPS